MTERPAVIEEAPGRYNRYLAVINDYITLTKPPIILLLLITAAGGMVLAAQGLPSLPLLGIVWIGGALASAGANAINHQIDRDIDLIMTRTSKRPVASQRITPGKALAFGIILNVVAFLVLVTWVNLLAALLTLSATLFYVFIYTLWLKRSTPQNIVIGGAAGSIPPLVGWAAVTGGIDLPAVYLFTIVFFWTPPHFWALSLLIQEDYEKARIPMLPVVATRDYTTLNVFLYTIVLVGITLAFAYSTSVHGIYLCSALILGGMFLVLSWRLKRSSTRKLARTVYLFSLLYLALLFVAIMVDTMVPILF
tara:strand:- start:490 stop:1413 length:924 start_codon:yes stop_codon:yes gene_type:complete